jgi:hypothetical protein
MTNNQFYLHSSPSGIKLIEGDKMPVHPKDHPRFKSGMDQYSEPLETNGFWQKGIKDYEAAIQSAKASSIPIQDQDAAWRLIFPDVKEAYNFKVDSEGLSYRIGNQHYSRSIKKDHIYGPFSVGYEIRKKCLYTGTCPDCNLGSLCKTVAILYDDTPEKEESREEGIRLLDKCDRTFESLRKIIIILKEAEPEKLPELVHNIEIDFEGIQAVIRDYTRKFTITRK